MGARTLVVGWLLVGACGSDGSEPRPGSTTATLCLSDAPPAGDLAACSAILLPQLDPREGSPDYLICTRGKSINASGVVAGETCDDKGFVWSVDDLDGALLQPSLSASAEVLSPSAINGAGDIVGGFVPAGARNGDAFRLAAGELMALPRLEQTPDGHASDINDAGIIVGQVGASDLRSRSFAVYWEAGELHRIDGVDQRNGGAAGATAINQNGTIVGYSNTAEVPGIQAFRWTPGGDVEILPTLEDGHVGAPADINDAGVVVGRDGGPLPDLVNEAVYWDEDGNIHQLPGLHDTPEIGAVAINNRGVIVGHEMTPEFITTEARLWLDGEVHHLQDLVPVPEPYRLIHAADINDSDEVIALAAVDDDGPIRHVTLLLRPDL